jgi:hypothetical protein
MKRRGNEIFLFVPRIAPLRLLLSCHRRAAFARR